MKALYYSSVNYFQIVSGGVSLIRGTSSDSSYTYRNRENTYYLGTKGVEIILK